MRYAVRNIFQLLLLLGFGVFSLTVQAGSAQIDTRGSISNLEFSGPELLRFDNNRLQFSLVHRHGEIFMIKNGMTLNAASAVRSFVAGMPNPAPQANGIESLKNTGRSEIVAGIKGEVWTISYIDESRQLRHSEMVLSADPRVLQLRDAVYGFARSIAATSGNNMQDTAALYRTLQETGRGCLRFGNDMRVVMLSGQQVASSRFSLPSAPINLPDLDTAAGVLNGLFGR